MLHYLKTNLSVFSTTVDSDRPGRREGSEERRHRHSGRWTRDDRQPVPTELLATRQADPDQSEHPRCVDGTRREVSIEDGQRTDCHSLPVGVLSRQSCLLCGSCGSESSSFFCHVHGTKLCLFVGDISLFSDVVLIVVTGSSVLERWTRN